MLLDSRLNIFLAVAEYESFSKAAKALYISQPAVSLQVQNLEDYYGLKLFERQEKRVVLTLAGSLVHKYASQMKHLNMEILQEIRTIGGLIRGKLTIGATLTIGEYILPRIVGEFKRLHPEVELLLEIANTERVSKQVVNNRIDLGLIEGPYDNLKLKKEKFMEDELVVVVGCSHPWAKRQTISLEELKTQPIILREPGSGTRLVLEETLKRAKFELKELNILMELGSTETIKGSVENGLGITIISKCTLNKELKLGILKTLRIDAMPIRREFEFLFSSNSLTTAALEFKKLCSRLCKELEIQDKFEKTNVLKTGVMQLMEINRKHNPKIILKRSR